MFTIELELPSGKKTRIRELNNREYLSILKFCENKDYYGLNDFFEKLYFTPDLNIFDRFFILIYVRKLFVSDKLIFKGEGDIDITYSLNDVLSKLVDNYQDQSRTLTYNDIDVNVDIPLKLYFHDIDDLYQYTITDISFKGQSICFVELTDDEKATLLSKLPSPIFNIIHNYIKDLSSNLFDLTIIEENKDFDISEIKINMLGNGVLYFLSSIFAYDLINFYETLYYYNHFVSPGSKDFFDLTFNETRLLLNIHTERVERENKEIERREQQNNG